MAKKKDLFNKGFDGGTQIKLHILRKYLQEWLPVFLRKKEKFWKDIFLYDFFAGEGKDTEGLSGSPLIMLEELSAHCNVISNENLNLKLFINEFDKKRLFQLKKNLDEKLSECNQTEKCPNFQDGECVLNVGFENKLFKDLFSQ